MFAVHDWKKWKIYRETIELCLRAGFAPVGENGTGPSIEEARRRLVASGILPGDDPGRLVKWVRTQQRLAAAGRRNELPNWLLFKERLERC